MFKNKKSKVGLPAHPKKLHKPFRWRHLALFIAGVAFGVFSTYRGGYLEEQKFDINSVSPATVKIYRFVCGVLVIENQRVGNDVCDASVGTGFLISSDGYIATNGHVVTQEAADILINELRNNPALFQQYALNSGLTLEQAYDPRNVNKFLADIYDKSPSSLRLDNRREGIMVALGDRPVIIKNQSDIRALLNKPDTDCIKNAKVVATDYKAKDLLIIEQPENNEGFSASDLAILKINAINTPFINLADTSTLQQNDSLSLIGFPADAENQLTSNSTISPSVTNGSVSSLRIANGSASRLIQTDADASQGSSGGPAINGFGEAIGITTYRFKDNNQANAAKSYVRDISDLKDLLSRNKISLNTLGSTQTSWEEGLRLAQQNKYSKAIEKYQEVLNAYPAHRLVNIYGVQAQKAVDAGRDYKDPKNLIITVGAGVIASIGLVSATTLILRHHKNHRHYKRAHTQKRETIKPTTKNK
jgi:serine protease Do